jgi:hypothetical protein
MCYQRNLRGQSALHQFFCIAASFLFSASDVSIMSTSGENEKRFNKLHFASCSIQEEKPKSKDMFITIVFRKLHRKRYLDTSSTEKVMREI